MKHGLSGRRGFFSLLNFYLYPSFLSSTPSLSAFPHHVLNKYKKSKKPLRVVMPKQPFCFASANIQDEVGRKGCGYGVR